LTTYTRNIAVLATPPRRRKIHQPRNDAPRVVAYQTTVAPLSEREREVFRYLGSNYSTKQIGDILGMSHKTVEVHLEKMKRELLVETTKELRLKAIIAVSNGAA